MPAGSGTSSMRMGQSVSVEVYGDEIVARELEATGLRALSMEPLWDAVIRSMEMKTAEQFNTAGARSGHPWEPLSEEYMFRKWTRGENLAVMRASDALFDSLTGPTGHSVRFKTNDSLEFGSTLEQFAVHQDRPANADYPERLPVDFTQEDTLEWADMMLSYIVGSTDKYGRRMPRRQPAGSVLGGRKVGGQFISD